METLTWWSCYAISLDIVKPDNVAICSLMLLSMWITSR